MNDRQIVEYRILQSSNSFNLTTEVNKFIKDGWHVYGHLCQGNNYTLFQTMVKYSPPSRIDPVMLIG